MSRTDGEDTRKRKETQRCTKDKGKDLHVKHTDKHQYLRMDSFHPIHYKASTLTVKRSNSGAFAWRNRFLKVEPANFSNILSHGTTTSSTWSWINKSRECSILPGMLTCSQNRGNKVCLHSFGGHLPSNFSLFSQNHQVTSPYPSCFRMPTEGFSVSSINCLLLSKKLEGLPGSSNSYIYCIWATWQLLVGGT